MSSTEEKIKDIEYEVSVQELGGAPRAGEEHRLFAS